MRSNHIPMAAVPQRSRPWRVLTRLQVALLCAGSFLTGCNLVLIAWGLDVGRPLIRLVFPAMGVLLAIWFVVFALWSAQRAD